MNRGGRAVTCLLLLVACRKPALEPAPALLPTDPALEAPAGRLEGGTYVDNRWPLAVPVPPGWRATIGPADAEERLTLDAPSGGTQILFAATAGTRLEPRPRDGCTWTFADVARYRVARVPVPVLAATCTPDEPGAPRVLAYAIPHGDGILHVECRLPPGQLHAGKAALDALLGQVRLR